LDPIVTAVVSCATPNITAPLTKFDAKGSIPAPNVPVVILLALISGRSAATNDLKLGDPASPLAGEAKTRFAFGVPNAADVIY